MLANAHYAFDKPSFEVNDSSNLVIFHGTTKYSQTAKCLPSTNTKHFTIMQNNIHILPYDTEILICIHRTFISTTTMKQEQKTEWEMVEKCLKMRMLKRVVRIQSATLSLSLLICVCKMCAFRWKFHENRTRVVRVIIIRSYAISNNNTNHRFFSYLAFSFQHFFCFVGFCIRFLLLLFIHHVRLPQANTATMIEFVLDVFQMVHSIVNSNWIESGKRFVFMTII